MIKYYTVLLLFFSLFCAGGSHALEDAQLIASYNSAIDRYVARDYDASSKAFYDIITYDNSDYRVYNNLGISYLKEYEYNQAVTILKYARTLDDDVDVLYNLAYAAYKRGTYSECEKYVLAILEAERHEYKKISILAGLVYYQQGRYDSAIEYMKRYLEIDAKSYEALFIIGMSYLNTGKLSEACLGFQACIDASPDDALAHYNLGVVYLNNGEFNNAIVSFFKAYERDNTLYDSHFNIAVASIKLKAYDKSIEHFKKYLELKPDAADASDVRERIKDIASLK